MALLKAKKTGIYNISSAGVVSQEIICRTFKLNNIVPIYDDDDYKVRMDISKLNMVTVPSSALDSIMRCFETLEDKLEL